MSEKPAKSEKPSEAPAAEKPKKKGGMKVILAVVGAMVVEGVAMFLVLGMGGPKSAQADEQSHDLSPDESQVAEEILVVEEKFQNLQTGRVWVWDASIYVQVMSTNKEKVEEILKRRAATVKEGISQIFSRSQHAQLAEPERQTLNRQIMLFLDQLMQEEQKSVAAGGGHDSHAGGHDSHAPAAGAHDDGAVIKKVLIPKCRGFPTDF